MSWHYLPEQAADSLGAVCADGAPLSPSRSIASGGNASCNGRQKASSSGFPSGTTSRPSTGDRFVDAWTSSLEATRASQTARRTPMGSVLRHLLLSSYELSRKYALGGSCGRTLPKSARMLHGRQIALPQGLRGWVTSRRLLRSGRVVWALTINERGCSCLAKMPTPTKAAATQGELPDDGRRGQSLIGAARGQGWPRAQRMPTPTSSMVTMADMERERYRHDDPSRPSCASATMGTRGGLPTPTSRDWRSGKASQLTLNLNARPLNEVVVAAAGGQGSVLHPEFVEWMMGWPLGWTGLPRLETDKFQQWLELHGAC